MRYVDDVFAFADSRAALRSARREIAAWIDVERGLRLKHPDAPILSCHGHLDGLGYRITRAGIRALPRALERMRQRIAIEMDGGGDVEIARSIASTSGIVLF